MVSSFDIPDRILVAIGGNATHPEDIEGTSREQKAIAASIAEAIAAFRGENGTRVVADDGSPRSSLANTGTDRRADGSSRP